MSPPPAEQTASSGSPEPLFPSQFATESVTSLAGPFGPGQAPGCSRPRPASGACVVGGRRGEGQGEAPPAPGTQAPSAPDSSPAAARRLTSPVLLTADRLTGFSRGCPRLVSAAPSRASAGRPAGPGGGPERPSVCSVPRRLGRECRWLGHAGKGRRVAGLFLGGRSSSPQQQEGKRACASPCAGRPLR